MRRLFLKAAAVAAWLAGVAFSHEDSAQPDIQSLRPKLSDNAQIILPTSKQFDNATARWSLLDPPRVDIVTVPATENDVVEIVRIFYPINIENLFSDCP